MTNPEPASNRREFLQGKAALDAIRSKIVTPQPLSATHRGDSSVEQPSNKNANEEAELQRSQREQQQQQRAVAYLEQYSKNAMACEFEIMFNLQQYPAAGLRVAQAFQLIDDLEDQLTVYRDHSELSRLNQTADRGPVVVEKRLFELLQTAVEIFEQTNGAFDITAGALTKLWKFDRRAGAIPEPCEIEKVLANVGSQFLRLDQSAESIEFDRSGIEINLGGIGKGHALDRVAEDFLAAGIRDFIIHGGQSSVLAMGESLEENVVGEASDVGGSGWRVGISHPLIPSTRLAEITLRNQALGTSGTGRQGFFNRGKRYGHIIDPRTGWPASHFLSTTVISDSAACSDALATAFFVMELPAIEAYCATHPKVGTVLVSQAKSGNVVVQCLNLDEATVKIY